MCHFWLAFGRRGDLVNETLGMRKTAGFWPISLRIPHHLPCSKLQRARRAVANRMECAAGRAGQRAENDLLSEFFGNFDGRLHCACRTICPALNCNGLVVRSQIEWNMQLDERGKDRKVTSSMSSLRAALASVFGRSSRLLGVGNSIQKLCFCLSLATGSSGA